MKATDRPAFYQRLTRIGILYGSPVHEVSLQDWWELLENFEFSAIEAALKAHMQHPERGQYMPKPADVTRHWAVLPGDKAVKAWGEVMQAIQRVGSYGSPTFDDPLIPAIIRDMGGWGALCRSEEVNLPFRAKDFERHYQSFLRHPPADLADLPKQLTGLVDAHNQRSLRSSQQPVLAKDLFSQTLSSFTKPPLEVV